MGASGEREHFLQWPFLLTDENSDLSEILQGRIQMENVNPVDKFLQGYISDKCENLFRIQQCSFIL